MNPLGYVETPNGKKAIFPMHDIFLGYTFQNPENWEILRTMINIIIEEYCAANPSTTASPITGNITVKTQYRHFLSPQSTPLSQDAHIEVDKQDSYYIEFQRDPLPKLPISIRSTGYFGLGISKAKGELAAHLLGETVSTPMPRVEKVIEYMGKSFVKFKTDKDVIEVMTIAEHWQEEAEKIGEARGEARGSISATEELLKLIQQGLTPEQAAEKIRGKYMALIQR